MKRGASASQGAVIQSAGAGDISAKGAETLASLSKHAQEMVAEGALCDRHRRVIEYLVATAPMAVLEHSYAFRFQLPKERWRDTIETVLAEELGKRWAEVSLLGKYSVDKAKAASEKERQKLLKQGNLGQGEDSLVYGEIGFPSFASLFQDHLPSAAKLSGGNFYDIGSGTGRGVFAAWLLADFAKCVGVELMSSLYNISTEALGDLKKMYAREQRLRQQQQAKKPHKKQKQQRPGGRGKVQVAEVAAAAAWPWPDPSTIELVEADFRRVDWSDADVVFCASTCFDAPMMKWLATSGEKLKPGAYFITLSYRLDEHSDQLEHVREAVYRMTWGRCSVHIHRRR